MTEIEFKEPKTSKCDCCGQKVVSLTRFVYQDGDAFAVYYARFTLGHNEKIVQGLIGLGDWGMDDPKDRIAFPFEIWTDDEEYKVGLIDKKESLWRDATFLGRILDREEALTHSWIKEVYHITDHIVTDDKLIVDFLQ